MRFAVPAIVLVLLGCTQQQQDTSTSGDPFPAEDRVLLQDVDGGWETVAFVHRGDPVGEARRCVQSRPDATAVMCFAYASSADYAAARDAVGSNLKRDECWDAIWQRDAQGQFGGTENTTRPDTCASRAAPTPE